MTTTRRRSRSARRRAGWFTLGLVLLVLYLFPVYWMFATSLKTNRESFSSPPKLVPIPMHLDAWRTAFRGSQVPRYLLNSLVIASGTTILTLVLAAPAAFALTHLRIRDRGISIVISLFSLMLPAVMLTMPMYQIFAKAQLLNSYAGLIIANATLTVPFALLLIRPLFAVIPYELLESAQLDGCNVFGVFVRIILPLAKPALATAATFAFLMSWGDLVFAISLTNSDSMRPITAGLWNAIGSNVTDWSQLTALASVAVIPTLVVLVIAQRFVIAGLAASGLKE